MRPCFYSLLVATALALLCSPVQGKTLTYQGKTLAAIKRAASVPFTILVEEVLVSVGDRVDKDARLLRYSLQPRETRQYSNLLSDPYIDILDLREKLANSKVEVKSATGSVKRDRELVRNDLVPRLELQRNVGLLDAAQQRQNVLRHKLQAKQRDYKLLLAEYSLHFGHTLSEGATLPEKLYVIAPMAGSVIDMATALRPGMLLGSGATVAMIAALDPIQAEVHVHASEIGRLHQGMDLEVEIPDLDGRKFTAHVTSISWSSTDMKVGMPSFYVVQIDIDNKDHVIRPGYKVLLHFETD